MSKKKARSKIDQKWCIPQEVVDLIMRCPGFDMKRIREAAARFINHAIMASIRKAAKGHGHPTLVDPKDYRETALQISTNVLLDLQGYRNNLFVLGQIIEYHLIADGLSDCINARQAA